MVNDEVRPSDAAVGLSAADADARRRRDGPNRLPEPKRPSGLRRFAGELVHFFALMLWLAGLLALIAGMPALGIAIFGRDRGERRVRRSCRSTEPTWPLSVSGSCCRRW